MPTTPLPLCPWVEQRFFLEGVNGTTPNAGGLIYTYDAGLATLRDTFTGNSTADPVHPNPIELDADGRPPDPIYIDGAYTFDVRDADDVPLYTVDYVADLGQLYASTFGQLQAAGGKGVTLPYTVLSTDRSITVDDLDVVGSFGVLTLPDVTTWQYPIFVINESDAAGGGKIIRLTPQGGQSIQNGISGAAYFSLDPATTLCFWAMLYPDAANDNWLVFSNQT